MFSVSKEKTRHTIYYVRQSYFLRIILTYRHDSCGSNALVDCRTMHSTRNLSISVKSHLPNFTNLFLSTVRQTWSSACHFISPYNKHEEETRFSRTYINIVVLEESNDKSELGSEYEAQHGTAKCSIAKYSSIQKMRFEMKINNVVTSKNWFKIRVLKIIFHSIL